MIAPAVGMVIVLATLGGVGMGLLALAVGLARDSRRWARLGGRLAAATVAAYGIIWLVATLGSPKRALPVGGEVSFCGLDCHLHVSVVRADWGRDLGVVVRFRSNARAADEYPGLLTVEVVDSASRRYRPSEGMIAEPLNAGATIEREFHFSLPPEAVASALVLSNGGWLDYLLPGRGNPIAQRRIRLALDRA